VTRSIRRRGDESGAHWSSASLPESCFEHSEIIFDDCQRGALGTIGQYLETGKVLDLSPEGVRRAIKRGDIPAMRIGPKTLRVPTS
jgi:hypothetical protein